MNPATLYTGPSNVFRSPQEVYLLPLDSNSLHNLAQSCNPYLLLQGAALLSLCVPVSFLLGRVPVSVQ